MSSAIDLLETSDQSATQRVHAYCVGDGEKPEPHEWIQMLGETTGIVLKVEMYYITYDSGTNVTVHSEQYSDEHGHSSTYIESMLEYYEPVPVYETNIGEDHG